MAERRMDMVPGDEPHVSVIMQRLRGYSKGPSGAQGFAIACLDEMFPRVESLAQVPGLPPGTVIGRLGDERTFTRTDHWQPTCAVPDGRSQLLDDIHGDSPLESDLRFPLRVLVKGGECELVEGGEHCCACEEYETPSW